jgi:hypothetical protein
MTIRIDDHTGKHSTKGMRTDAQRRTANIPTVEVEKLLLSCVFFFFLPLKNKKD